MQENLTPETKYKSQGVKEIFWFQKIKLRSQYISHLSREPDTTGCTCACGDLFEGMGSRDYGGSANPNSDSEANRLETQGGDVI